MVSLGERRRGTFTAVLATTTTAHIATVAIDLPSEFKHLEPSLRSGDVCGSPWARHPRPPDQTGAALILALGRPGRPSGPTGRRMGRSRHPHLHRRRSSACSAST
jgi:hypothetical protein